MKNTDHATNYTCTVDQDILAVKVVSAIMYITL